MASIGVRIHQSPYATSSGTGLGSLLAGFLDDPEGEAQLARVRLYEQTVNSQLAQDAIRNREIEQQIRERQANEARINADTNRIKAEQSKISADRAQIEQQNAGARQQANAVRSLW